MVNMIFDACVVFLIWMAEGLGMSYKAVNIWIFVVVWPIFTVGLIVVNLRMRRQIKGFKRNLLN